MENNFKKIHFVGIKGVGMAALAVLAKEMGYEVSGSDDLNSYVTDQMLNQAGLAVTEFDVDNLKTRPDLIVVSAAYDSENVEVKEAKKRHLSVIPYSEALAKLSANSKVIAVSGIHGKTTTTAMISFLLKSANLDPSYVVGSGQIAALNQSAHYGHGEYFVLEADEYKKSTQDPTPKFLDLSPFIEVITSIELDHPDMFFSVEDVYKVFYDFACRVPRGGFIAICHDYPKARRLINTIADRTFESYGFSHEAKWQIVNFSENETETSFEVQHDGEKLGPFRLVVPGEANVLNATAALIVALKLGISKNTISMALEKFNGVKRRFEIISQTPEVVLVDDYAHHPRSVQLTLEAVKRKYSNRQIWCVFQPHTYSRTKALIGEFSTAFKSADRVIVTDIYASARESKPTISGEELAISIRANQANVKYIDNWEDIIKEIKENIQKPAAILTMGAGDIYKLQMRLKDELND